MGDIEKLYSEQYIIFWVLFGEFMINYGFIYFVRMYLKYNKESLIFFK